MSMKNGSDLEASLDIDIDDAVGSLLLDDGDAGASNLRNGNHSSYQTWKITLPRRTSIWLWTQTLIMVVLLATGGSGERWTLYNSKTPSSVSKAAHTPLALPADIALK
jgi:hypothetical protein